MKRVEAARRFDRGLELGGSSMILVGNRKVVSGVGNPPEIRSFKRNITNCRLWNSKKGGPFAICKHFRN